MGFLISVSDEVIQNGNCLYSMICDGKVSELIQFNSTIKVNALFWSVCKLYLNLEDHLYHCYVQYNHITQPSVLKAVDITV